MEPTAIISAGLGLAQGIGNMFSQGATNRKNREWQEHMWNKNNEYNHPALQMQRFKEAGLNPHLIYGQGNNGNATMAPAPNQEAPKMDFADTVMNYVAVKKQQTEIDNMEKTREVMESQKQLNEANAAVALKTGAYKDYEIKLAEELYQNTVAGALLNTKNVEATNQKLIAEIQKIGTETNVSKKQLDVMSQNISESAQRIKLMKADGQIKGIEAEIKKIELEIRRRGGNPNDPAWQKILLKMAEQSGILPRAFKEVSSGANNIIQKTMNKATSWGRTTREILKQLWTWDKNDPNHVFNSD